MRSSANYRISKIEIFSDLPKGNLSRHFSTLENVIDALDFNLDFDKRALNKTGSSWLVGTH